LNFFKTSKESDKTGMILRRPLKNCGEDWTPESLLGIELWFKTRYISNLRAVGPVHIIPLQHIFIKAYYTTYNIGYSYNINRDSYEYF
jgi:hypothetical protein